MNSCHSAGNGSIKSLKKRLGERTDPKELKIQQLIESCIFAYKFSIVEFVRLYHMTNKNLTILRGNAEKYFTCKTTV